MTAEQLPIDHHQAIGVVQPIVNDLRKAHVTTLERIEALSSNDGARIGMRTVYGVKIAALVKAVNDLVHFQHEIDQRSLDVVSAIHEAQARDAVHDLLVRSGLVDRFPSNDEQS
jgi:hypothetical protein